MNRPTEGGATAGPPPGDARAAAKPETNRRQFIKKAGVAGAAATAVAAGGYLAATPDPATSRRLGMVIDLPRCTGCRACAVACKSENHVHLGAFRSHVNQIEIEEYGHVTRHFVPRLCNHCQRPACTRVCPVGATYQREDGLVMVNKDRCIGCRYCLVACPYGARSFKWHRTLPNDLAAVLEENGMGREIRWPARIYGTVDKCDFCVHRIDQGVEPACVNTCPARARIFGDFNDPESDVSRIVATTPVNTLAPELGTEPSVYYVGLDHLAAETSFKEGARLEVVTVRRTFRA